MQQRPKTTPIVEDDENHENFEYGSATTNTRTSGSTILKRKSELDEKDAKKMTTYPRGAHTVIVMNNPRITNFGLPRSKTTSPRTPPSSKEVPTVQSTPRET
eukprot:1185303-Amphidinium_carterae.1